MFWKLIGAILVIGGCGFFGWSICTASRREEAALLQLIRALDYMHCELQYRLTPLPDLCTQASREQKGLIGLFLQNLAQELESQISPDVTSCVRMAINRTEQLPERVRKAFLLMGATLGRFDTEGQIHGLEQVRQYCRNEIHELNDQKETRLRSYQTLSLCAGAALAILFV